MIEKKSRLRDLHLASVMDKEVLKEHAQWWQPAMREKIDTETRMDPGAPLMVDGGGPWQCAWVAEERNRILGQGVAEGEERTSSDLVQKAEVRE